MEFPSPEKVRDLLQRHTKVQLTEKEVALLKALNTPITLSFEKRPLQTVIDELEKNHGIRIDLDGRALEESKRTPQLPVTFKANRTPLRSALRKMLGDVGLTFTIRAEGLRITSLERARDDMVVRVHYTPNLAENTGFTMEPNPSQLQTVQNIAALINRVQSIEPSSWEFGGGRGRILFEPSTMSFVVKQSVEMQFVLQGLLRR